MRTLLNALIQPTCVQRRTVRYSLCSPTRATTAPIVPGFKANIAASRYHDLSGNIPSDYATTLYRLSVEPANLFVKVQAILAEVIQRSWRLRCGLPLRPAFASPRCSVTCAVTCANFVASASRVLASATLPRHRHRLCPDIESALPTAHDDFHPPDDDIFNEYY
jgi:hypothetical protein